MFGIFFLQKWYSKWLFCDFINYKTCESDNTFFHEFKQKKNDKLEYICVDRMTGFKEYAEMVFNSILCK